MEYSLHYQINVKKPSKENQRYTIYHYSKSEIFEIVGDDRIIGTKHKNFIYIIRLVYYCLSFDDPIIKLSYKDIRESCRTSNVQIAIALKELKRLQLIHRIKKGQYELHPLFMYNKWSEDKVINYYYNNNAVKF